MKKLITTGILPVILLFFFIEPACSKETQTLLSQNVRHGGYGGIHFGVIMVHGAPELLRGSRGAWIINFQPDHAINIGLGNYRTETHFSPVNWPHENIDQPEMRLRHRGLEIEYVNRTRHLLHFSTQVTIGSGTVRYQNPNDALQKTRDSYFSIQPAASLNLNVARWFRVNVSAGYHFAGNTELDGTSGEDLSGLISSFGLRFGKF